MRTRGLPHTREERERAHRRDNLNTPCLRWLLTVVKCAEAASVPLHGVPRLRQDDNFRIVMGGSYVEETTSLVKQANTAVKEARSELETTVNQMKKMMEIVSPLLKNQISELRTLRQSITSESELSMRALREVRQFFIESDYDKEMTRLERFLKLCNELKALQRDGTLDVLSEVVIRLAVQETKA